MFGNKELSEQMTGVINALESIKEGFEADKAMHAISNARMDKIEGNLAGLQKWVAALDKKVNAMYAAPKLGDRAEG